MSSFAVHCFLHVYPNVVFRSPVGDGLPAELLFRSCLGGIHGRYPLASDCNDTPGSEPYRKPRGIYAGQSLAPSCRSPNHLVISMHKRKHKRSCCQLLCYGILDLRDHYRSPDVLTTHIQLNLNQNQPHYNYSLLEILPLERS